MPEPELKKVGNQTRGQNSEGKLDQQVRDFFLKYEKANSSSDVSAIAGLYADTFMFGGPNGVQAVKNEDFLRVVPKMKAHFSSMGLSDTRLQSVEAKLLDSKYLLVAVVWRMKLRTVSGSKDVDASASYVLVRGQEDALSIVFQIDHQDLAKVLDGQQKHEIISQTGQRRN